MVQLMLQQSPHDRRCLWEIVLRNERKKITSEFNEQTGLEMTARICLTQSPTERAQLPWALGKWRL